MPPNEPEDDILLQYLDPNFGVAIAYVISYWAMFEYEVDQAIWDLASVEPEPGACLTSQFTTVASRFNALISLARLKGKSESIIGKINKVKDRALAAAEKRNRVAHDPWFTAWESNKQFRLQKTSRGRLDYEYKAVTENDLKSLSAEIQKLTEEFRNLFRESLASWIDYRV